MIGAELEDVWRREVPHVLGSLVRRYGDFAGCEDAVQEALITAAHGWPTAGVPESPRGWLIRVASRRLIDAQRSDRARAERERAVTALEHSDAAHATAADQPDPEADDTVALFMLCCHPALTPESQVALTLRAVAGLTTAQVAAAFLVPESTMAQRISRAKATLRSAGARFAPPPVTELPGRLAAVLQVIYLVFNEGYTASSGERLVEVSVTQEAIRLARELHARLPSHHETTGLLALMLLTDARTAARTDARGDLVALEHQDRSVWNQSQIREGVGLLEDVLPRGHVGAFQLQAAIAAVHAEARAWTDTDWPQIAELYRMLAKVAPSRTVTLNLAVAICMADGPLAGLALVDPLLGEPATVRHHRTHAVRAHLLEMAEKLDEAVDEYATAARLTRSVPEQRYLNARLNRLRDGDSPAGRG